MRTTYSRQGRSVKFTVTWEKKNNADKLRYQSGVSSTPRWGRGFLWEFVVGVTAQFSQSWPHFRPKNCHFHTRFQTRPLKSFNRFRPDAGTYYVIISYNGLKCKENDFLKFILKRILLFRCYSFGIEAINPFMQSRQYSLENHTWKQT